MEYIDYKEVFLRVDIELRKKGLSRTAFEAIGISGANISHWSSGKRVPNCTAIAQIAKFLDVSLEWLLFGREKEGELTRDEKDLLEAYRQLSVQSRAVVLTAAKCLRQ